MTRSLPHLYFYYLFICCCLGFKTNWTHIRQHLSNIIEMHGRIKVKTTKEKEEERKQKEREKAVRFQQLTKEIFALRKDIEEGEKLDEAIKSTTELLLVNPDFYTIWNIRRQALIAYVKVHEADSEIIYKDELTFTKDCLRKNEKSYSVWQHRIWILAQMPKTEYENELKLCDHLLSLDERNFHCWDYRKYISDIAGTCPKNDLAFTTEKIKSNFSNFSAWHLRNKIFCQALGDVEKSSTVEVDKSLGPHDESCNIIAQWKNEYQMVLNALFTDPTDQSPWLYHRWLIMNNFGHLDLSHIENLKELLKLEPNNKWVILSLSWTNAIYAAQNKIKPTDDANLYDKLIQIDPIRRNYYLSCKSKNKAIRDGGDFCHQSEQWGL